MAQRPEVGGDRTPTLASGNPVLAGGVDSCTEASPFPDLGLSDTLDKCGYRDSGFVSDTLAVLGASDLARLAEGARKTLDDAIPKNTRLAYEGDLRRFAAWCTGAGLTAMPAKPETIVLYMEHLRAAGRRAGTIERAVAAISTSHVRAGHPSPWAHRLVEEMRLGLRRVLGVRPTKKRAADDVILRQMLAVLPATLLGVRDRALLTIDWAMAGRRSEPVYLDVGDIRPTPPKGLVLLVRRSKTDQEQRGEELPVCYANAAEHCPVRSLDAWLEASGITDGAIFRRLGREGRLGARLAPAAVAARIKHWARIAGLPWREFSGHSMRSGFVRTAVRKGKREDAIMLVTRHRDPRSLREYFQRENIFEDAAGEGLLRSRRPMSPTADDVRRAHHEAGHVIVATATGSDVYLATIVPDDVSDGYVRRRHHGLHSLRWMADSEVVPFDVLRRLALNEARVYLAGRACEELLSGVSCFGASEDEAVWADDDEWLDDVLEWDSDIQRAVECITIANPRAHDIMKCLETEYIRTIEYLGAHWLHVETLADALLDLWTIDPARFLVDLPPLCPPGTDLR